MKRLPAKVILGIPAACSVVLLAACSGPRSYTTIRPPHARSQALGVIDATQAPSGISASPYAGPALVVRPAPVSNFAEPGRILVDAQIMREPIGPAQNLRTGVPGGSYVPPIGHPSPTAVPTFDRAPQQPYDRAQVSDPRAAVVGLYGELIADRHDDGAQADGSSNLAQVSFATEGACFDPTVDPTGEFVAFASTMHQQTSDIYIKARDGRTHTQLTTDPADDVMPSFSPTGKQIAFTSNRGGSWDIYVMSVNGGASVQITNDSDHELHPTWSPDGRMIAYCRYSSRSGVWEIWVVDLESPGKKQFLEYGMFPQWSPDVAQNKILFQRARQRGSRFHSIWTIDYIRSEAVRPTEIVSAANAAVINPTWAPDGRRIAFVTVVEPETQPGGHPNMSDVWIVNADGTNRTNLTNGQYANFQPTWGTDGTVYFVSNRSGVDNIWGVSTGRSFNAIGPESQIVNVDPSDTPTQD